MRDSLCVLLLIFVVSAFAAAGQQEPTPPDANVFDSTGVVQPTAQAAPPTPDDHSLPPVFDVLPATTTPFPTPHVTPVLVLPTGEAPPACNDCAGQQPGFSYLVKFIASIRQLIDYLGGVSP